MSDADRPYQVMPELDDEKYERLKDDIRNHGIEYPIILDGDGEIVDGHHRWQAWVDLGRDPDDLPTRVVDDTDAETLHRAYRANLLRRDLSDGTKREVVKQYLLEHPDRVAEDTQAEIASDLGVADDTVRRARQELKDNGLLKFSGENFTTDEKRQQVRAYVEDNRNASNREVARQVKCDVTHVTVGNWRDEWDISEPTTGLDTYTNTKAEADKALDVVDTATDDEASEGVRETAAEKATEISDGETTPDRAAAEVEQTKHREDSEPETKTPPLPDETYRTLVIDPPWDMDKIERTERPQQGQYLDYPTMDIDEIHDLPIGDLAARDGAHVYLWATQKHLPTAFDCLSSWGARYECTMTWVKPTGVAPFSWQYNTEHVLFARFGDGLQLDQRGMQLSFEAPVTKHSAKPDVFYQRVRDASPGPRLNMFARQQRDGFDVWGDEA